MQFQIRSCITLAMWLLVGPAVVAQDTNSDEANVSSPGEAGAPGAIENSVVKVFATARYPDFYKPWTKQSPSEVTGSGVVIEGHRILSNAHVVDYANQVQVQANQSGNKVSATVEAVARGIDLAVLKLDDESFFDSHPPLPRDHTLPAIKDAVMAYGYPEGGTTLSITKGIISRIEFARYHFPVSGLRIQIDAAINPGNSGGPVIAGDKMIGLAFSRFGDADNIGYIIPSEEIELFLHDIKDGHYDGKPALFDDLQTLENPALRPFLKLQSSVHGIIVNKPFSDDPAYPLKKWDVITKIGDIPVDDQGMIKFGPNLRIAFAYQVQHLATNGLLPLTIVRSGTEQKVQVPTALNQPRVIPSLDGAYPSYFVFGPIAFSTATRGLLGSLTHGMGSDWLQWLSVRGSPILERMFDKPAFDGEQLVIVSSPLFPHRLSQGYSNPIMQVVKSVNEQPVKNLAHLVEILRDSREDFLTIEFASRTGSETIVLPRADALAATDEILSDNGIRNQGSPDTLAIWNASAAK